jgi:hypothetical protein
VLARLRSGITRRVLSIDAFNEGMDVPDVGLVAFKRMTDTMRIFYQQLGRGMRPGKKKLIVLDFVGNLERIQMLKEMAGRIAELHEKYTTVRERAREGYERDRLHLSGKGFEFTFSDKLVNLMEILSGRGGELYPTWQEAGEATVRLKIKGRKAYIAGAYRLDERLPANPHRYYRDFPGWPIFGNYVPANKGWYETCDEASLSAQALGIRDKKDYEKRYREDSKLPSSPWQFYPNFPGIPDFLGRVSRSGGSKKRKRTTE